MKRIESGRGDADESRSESRNTDPLAKELDGYVEAGMKSDAVRLARKILNQTTISAEAFFSALTAIFTLVDRLKPWTQTVTAAYARLTEPGQQSCRWLMLQLHCGNRDYQTAAGLLPATFGKRCNPFELGLALRIRLELDQLEEAAVLARKCMRALADIVFPPAKAILVDALADYFARVREWDQLTVIWEELRDDEFLVESALIGLVEVNAARALLAIQSGLETLTVRRKYFDTHSEIVIPGNDKRRWDEAEKRLLNYGKAIEKILPKARQKALGFRDE